MIIVTNQCRFSSNLFERTYHCNEISYKSSYWSQKKIRFVVEKKKFLYFNNKQNYGKNNLTLIVTFLYLHRPFK